MAEPVYQDTKATRKIFSLTKPIRAVSGGTGASKTISILFWLIDYAQSTRNKLISIVSESYPHLEKGAMLDFENIMKDRGYWVDKRWNRSRHVYEFETGSKMEFFSVDTYGKAHGPRRDILFINECNNVPYKIADQLMTRTRGTIWLDWNPTHEFWFYKELQDNERMSDDVEFIKLTYKDNDALDEQTVRRIEAHKDNKYWWQVYGEGELGELEGRVYSGWTLLGEDELPRVLKLECYGLDFGYTNDPTAIVAIYYGDGHYLVDEIAYGYGMTNKQIGDILKNKEQSTVIADSAEPKSIDELISYGLQVQPSTKGKDSVTSGVQLVQQQKMAITKRSHNVIKDYRQYMWKENKDGNRINQPEHEGSHAMDAIRYAITWLRPNEPKIEYKASEMVKPFYPNLGI